MFPVKSIYFVGSMSWIVGIFRSQVTTRIFSNSNREVLLGAAPSDATGELGVSNVWRHKPPKKQHICIYIYII